MLTLYKYLHESLLDDEDEILDRSNVSPADIAWDMLKEKKWGKMFYIMGGWRDDENPFKWDEKRKAMLFNGSIGSSRLLTDPNSSDILKDIIKEFICINSLVFATNDNTLKIDKSFAKQVVTRALYIHNYYNSDVPNVEWNGLNVFIDNVSNLSQKYLGKKSLGMYIDTLWFKANNMSFNGGELIFGEGIQQQKRDINFFGTEGLKELPIIKNFKSNAYKISMYGKTLLKSKSALELMNKLYVLNIEREFIIDGKQVIKKIKSFKDIYAVINNPKKYGYIYNNVFEVNHNLSITDLFPWVKDMKDLEIIYIRDNNIGISFRKKYTPSPKATLKDGWGITIQPLAE